MHPSSAMLAIHPVLDHAIFLRHSQARPYETRERTYLLRATASSYFIYAWDQSSWKRGQMRQMGDGGSKLPVAEQIIELVVHDAESGYFRSRYENFPK